MVKVLGLREKRMRSAACVEGDLSNGEGRGPTCLEAGGKGLRMGPDADECLSGALGSEVVHL